MYLLSYFMNSLLMRVLQMEIGMEPSLSKCNETQFKKMNSLSAKKKIVFPMASYWVY